MASLPPNLRHEVSTELGLVLRATDAGVVAPSHRQRHNLFRLWTDFLHSLGPTTTHPALDPYLAFAASDTDRITHLRLFAHRVRVGSFPGRGPVTSRSVEAALRAISQTFALAGLPDPTRAHGTTQMDRRLATMLRGYTKADLGPQRTKPFPLALLHRLCATPECDASPFASCRRDMIVLAFFFLLRPGEYSTTSTTTDSAPFRLADVQLWKDNHPLDLLGAPHSDLLTATSCALTFTTQKNGARGEKIGHGASGDAVISPTRALARRVLHIRSHTTDLSTPLSTYFTPVPHILLSTSITSLLRQITALFGAPLGYATSDITARSLRSGGAMALLCAGIPWPQIRLMGRWQSDEVFTYIHAYALPEHHTYVSQMLSPQSNSFLPAP